MLGFSTTSLIRKSLLLIFLKSNIPHLDTFSRLTFFDAITDDLYLLCSLNHESEQLFLLLNHQALTLKKCFDLIRFLHFKTASPVPRGES